MRLFQWAAAAAITLSCAACSKAPTPPPPPPQAEASPPAAPPAVAEAAAEAATPASATVAQPTPEPAATPSATPPTPAVQHFVASRERRIRALLNNAIARDVTGETEHAAAMAEARRAACRTQACVNQSYAAQEASLRRWEGSEDIR